MVKRNKIMPDLHLKGNIASFPTHGRGGNAPLMSEANGGATPLRDYNETPQERHLIQKEEKRVWETIRLLLSHYQDSKERRSRLLDITITSDTSHLLADLGSLKSLLVKAVGHGATRTGMRSYAWDISGNCQNGYERTLKFPLIIFNKEIKDRYKAAQGGGYYLDLTTRCRKCETCLRHRAGLWRIRVRQETMASARTWFGTLTLRPDRQFHYLTVARKQAAKAGIDFGALPAQEQFVLIHKLISREITLSIKRLRKNTKVPFKYFLVAEAHKSGEPHYHMLIHERSMAQPLRYEQLRLFWEEGFQMWKLVADVNGATYLCKYLSKSMLARVRASTAYGASLAPLYPLMVDCVESNRLTTTPKPDRS